MPRKVSSTASQFETWLETGPTCTLSVVLRCSGFEEYIPYITCQEHKRHVFSSIGLIIEQSVVFWIKFAPRIRGLVAENPLPDVVQLRVVVVELLVSQMPHGESRVLISESETW